MMGFQDQPQSTMFHYSVNLDKRVRSNHPLRKVNELIDFTFVYDEVKNCYGKNGIKIKIFWFFPGWLAGDNWPYQSNQSFKSPCRISTAGA